MIRSIALVLGLVLLAGCGSLGTIGLGSLERSNLWTEAHHALSAEDFDRAEAAFETLAREHEGTIEARESLFYLGALRLDPRNEAWDSRIAERRLDEYLAFWRDGGPRIYRYPEALALFELARQLNLPPEARVPELRPGERIVRIEERVEVPVEGSSELATEIERLRRELADRDARIRQQQEELERIRRTLTQPARGQ